MLPIFNLYQVFYDNSQDLDNNCIPYSTVNKNVSPYYENSIIIDIHDKELHLICDYIGVTSWRMLEKTKFTKSEIEDFINRNESPSYWYSNYDQKKSILRNNRRESIIYKSWEIILCEMDIDIEMSRLLPIFCNYWVIKSELLTEYIQFLKRVIDILNHNDQLIEICKSYKKHRDSYYPIETFILEYCFPVWILIKNIPSLKVKKSIYNKRDKYMLVKNGISSKINKRC